MPSFERQDIRLTTDEEKHRHYEQVDELVRKGEEVQVKKHKSGFPAVTLDCGPLHYLTDVISLERWWASKRGGSQND